MKDRMIISRTPLRITFTGGGTDLPAYFCTNPPGRVLSAAIDKYIHVTVNKKFDEKIRVSYSVTEIVDHVDQIAHPSVREALKLLDIDGGIEIVSISDIPSRGTGLGSSSTFLVGLLNALHAYRGEFVSADELGREAVQVERRILQEPGGLQDQYMAAFGGMQMLEFYPDWSVRNSPVIMKEEYREEFMGNLLLLYTGRERSSTSIHVNQSKAISHRENFYDTMRELTLKLYGKLAAGELDDVGRIMDTNWQLKKELAEGISDPEIDRLYELAIKNGAMGGKLIGAGGGGFLLFYAPKGSHAGIINALGLRKVDFKIDFQGSRIIFVGD